MNNGQELAYWQDTLVSAWQTHGPEHVYNVLRDARADDLLALIMVNIGARAENP